MLPRRRLGLWVALLGLATTPSAAAKAPAASDALNSRLRFEHLTVADGLPTNWVMSLLKDSYGFVWFGTHQGLARYDGTNLSVYRSDADDARTLPAPFVGMLFEDREKRLWVGFAWANAGVARYDRECDCFQRFAPREGFHDVRAMIEDRRGRLWVGTEDGIALFDPTRGPTKFYPLKNATARTVTTPVVNAILEDREGRIWVGADGGLFQFDPELGQYAPWPGAADDPLSLSRAAIWDLLEDPDGNLWATTIGAGLQKASPGTRQVQRYLPHPEDPDSISSARVRGLARDSEGRIYSGTENGGLNVLDPRTGRFTRYHTSLDDPGSLGSWSTWRLLLDDEGTLWVATHNGGVSWAAPAGSQFHTLEAQRGGLSDAHVSSLLEDHRGHLWMGTDGGGLNELDRTTDRFAWYRHDPEDPHTVGSNSIFGLMEDSRGDLWLGGWDSGLGLLDVHSGQVTRFRHDPADAHSIPSNNVWCVHELRTGELLVGTTSGPALFDRKSHRFRRLSETHPDVGEGTTQTAAEDSHGGLWLCGHSFAAEATIVHVDMVHGTVRRYGTSAPNAPESEPGVCLAVQVDSRENVWIGTLGALYVLEPGATRFRRWAPVADMGSDEASNILEDEAGNIWVSVGPRLLRIAGGTRLPPKPRVDIFDRRDGFHGPLPFGAAFRSPRGEMFFGGLGGVTSFFPRDFKPNERPPRVVLTDIKVLNRSLRPCTPGSPLAKSVPLADGITLHYDASMITFAFAALNFWLPQKNQYAYKLEGFDRDWSDAGSKHEASYTNLSPGQYTFRVRAANNDGVWSTSDASFSLRITPPFWATWWFRLALLTAVLGWAGHLHRQHVHRLTMEAQALGAKMEERTRLARELHDTLEQALAGIRLQLSVAARNLHGAPDAAAKSLDLARRMLLYSIEEARRAVMDLRSQALEEGGLERALTEQAGHLTDGTPIVVNVTITGTPRRLDFSAEHHLFRIAQEGITNAIKHSGGDRVGVNLSYDDTRTQLVIEDNGRGLPTEASADGRHFGRQGMRERAERLGGLLTVANRPEGGVRITVDVPARPANQPDGDS
jgi:signal transduction histidine kinase/ligand-binding sensor domain-containing protein